MFAYKLNNTYYTHNESSIKTYKHKKNLIDKLSKYYNCSKEEADKKICNDIPMESIIEQMEEQVAREEILLKVKKDKLIDLTKRYDKVVKRKLEIENKKCEIKSLEENLSNKINGGNNNEICIKCEKTNEKVDNKETQTTSSESNLLPSKPTSTITKVKVTLGINEIECYFYRDPHENGMYDLHKIGGVVVGTVDLMNPEFKNKNQDDPNIDKYGQWVIDDREIYLYEIYNDHIEHFGEIHKDFLKNPYYCELNTVPSRFIDMDNIKTTYTGKLYFTEKIQNNLINYNNE